MNKMKKQQKSGKEPEKPAENKPSKPDEAKPADKDTQERIQKLIKTLKARDKEIADLKAQLQELETKLKATGDKDNNPNANKKLQQLEDENTKLKQEIAEAKAADKKPQQKTEPQKEAGPADPKEIAELKNQIKLLRDHNKKLQDENDKMYDQVEQMHMSML